MTTSTHNRQHVVVCDRAGVPSGTAGLLEAHEGEGILHLAFSVFVFRNAGTELLLQRRSRDKRLFPMRWANTCCSHPTPGDGSVTEGAQRRLREELGFSVPIVEAGSFVYRAKDPDSDLSEYEYDTVLVGEAGADIAVRPDPAEVADWRWMSVADLQGDLRTNTDRYAPWLAEALRIALRSRPGRLDSGSGNG